MKITVLTNFMCTSSGIQYIYHVVQPSLLPISKTFLSFQTETVCINKSSSFPSPPSHWGLLFYFLFLYILLFQVVHVSEVRQHLSFCAFGSSEYSSQFLPSLVELFPTADLSGPLIPVYRALSSYSSFYSVLQILVPSAF